MRRMLNKWIIHPYNRLVVDCALATIPFYLMTKPLLVKVWANYSLKALITSIFNPNIANVIIIIGLLYLVICKAWDVFYHKILLGISLRGTKLWRDSSLTLLTAQNRQISKIFLKRKGEFSDNFCDMLKNYDNNIHMVMEAMNQFLLQYFSHKGISPDKIHISFMEKKINQNKLETIAHIDGKSYRPNTLSLDLQDALADNYGCAHVACKNQMYLLSKVTKENFALDDTPRRKSIKQYIGLPISADGTQVFGVINIEFHDKYFLNRSSMRKFIENYLFVFRLFLEYHCQRKIVGEQL